MRAADWRGGEGLRAAHGGAASTGAGTEKEFPPLGEHDKEANEEQWVAGTFFSFLNREKQKILF